MRLKELRLAEKLTQKEIADKINIKQFTYSNYETEFTQPTIQTLIALADYYKVSLDYLIGRNFVNEIGYLTADEKTLLENFRKMTDDNKQTYLIESKGILLAQNIK